MKAREIDIELRVRKTLTFTGPATEEAARSILAMILTSEMDPAQFVKWTDGRTGHRPIPVEVFIGNNPTVAAAREIPR